MTLVAPDNPADSRTALIALHGSNQDGSKLRKSAGYDLDAFAGHGPVVYLDGYRGNWNDARRSSQFAARRDGIDDVEFVRAVIVELRDHYGSDRFVIFGYSSGGSMALRLVHEMAAELAGAAIVSATQPEPANLLAVDSGAIPLPIALFHGTRDRLVPYTGGMASLWGFRPRGVGLSAPDTAAYLARRNGITAPPVTEPLPTLDERRVTITRRVHSATGSPAVTLFTAVGAGHTIPGPGRQSLLLGRTARKLVISTAMREAGVGAP